MNLLPTIWETTTVLGLSPPEVQYGFRFDVNHLGYAVYITNFLSLWVQELTRNDIVQQANSIGLEDIDDEAIVDLLKLVGDSSQNSSNLSLTLVENVIEVVVKMSGINWTFQLHRQLSEVYSEFMVRFCKQLLAVNKFSTYKIDELNAIIKIKDIYSKFLTENFKLSHGMDLINKFKKNNKATAEQFEPFNDTKWNKKLEISYAQESSTTSSQDFWQVLNKLLQEKPSWKFANELLVDKPLQSKQIPNQNPGSTFIPSSLPSQFETIDLDTIPDLKFSDDPFFRTSSPIKEEEEISHDIDSIPKLKIPNLNEEDSQISTSLSSSPIKRSPKKRGFGSFGPRKKLKRKSSSNLG